MNFVARKSLIAAAIVSVSFFSKEADAKVSPDLTRKPKIDPVLLANCETNLGEFLKTHPDTNVLVGKGLKKLVIKEAGKIKVYSHWFAYEMNEAEGRCDALLYNNQQKRITMGDGIKSYVQSRGPAAASPEATALVDACVAAFGEKPASKPRKAPQEKKPTERADDLTS